MSTSSRAHERCASPRVVAIGTRFIRPPVGKAIAAQLSDNDVLHLLASTGMQVETTRTIATPDEYVDELKQVRIQGFALDDGEHEEGARCVAVALPLVHEQAAISLSAPAVRFPLVQTEIVAAALTRAARAISGL